MKLQAWASARAKARDLLGQGEGQRGTATGGLRAKIAWVYTCMRFLPQNFQSMEKAAAW